MRVFILIDINVFIFVQETRVSDLLLKIALLEMTLLFIRLYKVTGL